MLRVCWMCGGLVLVVGAWVWAAGRSARHALSAHALCFLRPLSAVPLLLLVHTSTPQSASLVLAAVLAAQAEGGSSAGLARVLLKAGLFLPGAFGGLLAGSGATGL